MGRHVDVDNLIDVSEVAKVLGLSHKNSVTTYMKRYSDFPRPVIEFAAGNCRAWVRQDVLDWREGRKSHPHG